MLGVGVESLDFFHAPHVPTAIFFPRWSLLTAAKSFLHKSYIVALCLRAYSLAVWLLGPRGTAVSLDDDLIEGARFPAGTRNLMYGIWRSRCCGVEIVLYRGAVFPMCNKHPDEVTEWELVSKVFTWKLSNTAA